MNGFNRPMFAPTIGAALRAFSDEVQRGGDSQMSAHPTDYELFQLGFWEDETGRFEQAPQPLSIGRAIDFVKK